ncbi:hypothetical protein [Cupriavidus taiwanensis]|uniref:Uncharacterized protein n=1 Tax=Cupriavidus taiwanensis TaxID=164546 RepID=A0A375DKY0_9BURK|nr:hypothetical protein [Cupriavidus taiwanensis]SOY62881.1 hypothetical protein CBM2585_B130067 [Cupriavidus taiwanensis]SOZ08438.1 hypothetical protein CBM2597_B10242 [Cupriavidus taiwanensis]SOZ13228.1 hypothetical protein CBM2595_B80241 [Cupriavidus taiwanensis]SOZ41973.1 hypothetical protein CBM2598_B10492 [Cupriavidus taiwanensis]SPC14435.1 conserved hypothetical protein [Cupriavidus taiwanensis]
MQEFDFYLNLKKPTLGLYVRKGAGLPDLADTAQWRLEGTVAETDVPPDVLKGLSANGHAFQELGG